MVNEARKRQIRADWRIQRMKFFEERTNLILSYNQQFRSIQNTQSLKLTPDKIQTIDTFDDLIQSTSETEVNTDLSNTKELAEHKRHTDDIEGKNRNSEVVREEITDDNVEDQKKNDENDGMIADETTTKPTRPTNLNISENSNKISKLDLLNLNSTDEKINTAQNNKIKILQQEYDITPNNNEHERNEESLKTFETDLITDAQINKHKIMSQTYDFYLDPDLETISKKSKINNYAEAELNKLKFMQEEYGFTPNNNEYENITSSIEKSKYPEMNINKSKNMQHQININTQDVITPEVVNDNFLSEAQTNRNKIMSHTYNLPLDSDKNKQYMQNPLTDAQKNRNKNMAHSIQQNYDANEKSAQEDVQIRQTSKETPMSTATDHFTVSTISIPIISCEESPFSEITNDR